MRLSSGERACIKFLLSRLRPSCRHSRSPRAGMRVIMIRDTSLFGARLIKADAARATNSMTSAVSRPFSLSLSLSLSVPVPPLSPMETSSRETLAAVSRVRRHRNRQEPDSRGPNRGKCKCVVGTNPSPPYKAAPVGPGCSYAALCLSDII